MQILKLLNTTKPPLNNINLHQSTKNYQICIFFFFFFFFLLASYCWSQKELYPFLTLCALQQTPEFPKSKKNHFRISNYICVPKIMIFTCFVGQFLLVTEEQNRDTITDRQTDITGGCPT